MLFYLIMFDKFAVLRVSCHVWQIHRSNVSLSLSPPVSLLLTSSCDDVITGHRAGNQPMQSLNHCESAHLFLLRPHQRSQLVQIPAWLIISVVMSISLSLKDPLKHQNPRPMLSHRILTVQTPPLHGRQHYLPHPLPLIS